MACDATHRGLPPVTNLSTARVLSFLWFHKLSRQVVFGVFGVFFFLGAGWRGQVLPGGFYAVKFEDGHSKGKLSSECIRPLQGAAATARGEKCSTDKMNRRGRTGRRARVELRRGAMGSLCAKLGVERPKMRRLEPKHQNTVCSGIPPTELRVV